jgi:endo-beta-N-acetylglucosaminidase D
MADTTLPTGFDRHFRGYAWLDSIDRIGKWTESDADPIQISNTPLMKRPDVLPPQASGRSNIMLMHDSNHNGYDAAQVAASSIDRYTLEHWQSVEVFVYFGHRRAMVPPVSWINAGHRNGALVLGTFCCEGNYDDNGRILDKRSDGTGTYVLADALARIAKCYGFDGWLINIETGVGPYWTNLLANNGTGVAALIGQLKSKLPSGKVIW